jgi:anti-sigma-K factor RskA
VSAHRDEHLDLCAALATGSIEETDRLELERHLAQGCAECERALLEFSEATVALAATVPPAMPRPELRARVLEQARAERPGAAPATARDGSPAPGTQKVLRLPERRGTPWLSWTLAAAAAILAVATFSTWRASETLRTQLSAAQNHINRVERELAEERAWAAVATSPGARVADLTATPAGLTVPRVRATYDPASRRAIISFQGVTPPAGSDYELWAILPDGPKSLGVVHPDANGNAEIRVADAGAPEALAAFAVSLENQGGSPDPRKPAGPVVLVGAIKG